METQKIISITGTIGALSASSKYEAILSFNNPVLGGEVSRSFFGFSTHPKAGVPAIACGYFQVGGKSQQVFFGLTPESVEITKSFLAGLKKEMVENVTLVGFSFGCGCDCSDSLTPKFSADVSWDLREELKEAKYPELKFAKSLTADEWQSLGGENLPGDGRDYWGVKLSTPEQIKSFLALCLAKMAKNVELKSAKEAKKQAFLASKIEEAKQTGKRVLIASDVVDCHNPKEANDECSFDNRHEFIDQTGKITVEYVHCY